MHDRNSMGVGPEREGLGYAGRPSGWKRAWAFLPVMAIVAPATAQQELFHIDGEAFNEMLRVVAGAGDLDADGTGDLVAGSAFHGIVRAYSGKNGGTLFEIEDPVFGTGLGSSLDGAGDFDGDGVLDVVAGAPTDDTIGNNTGAVYVFSGVDGAQLCVLYGQQGNGRFGRTVAGVGDVNQDGFADIGVAGIFEKVRVFAGPDGHQIREHVGVLTRPSIAGVGDTDGDGHPDYAIGWPQDDAPIPNGVWAGRVSVFSGRNGSEIHRVYGETGNDFGGIVGDHFGMSVSGAGDVNADGVPDFVAGGPGEFDLLHGASQSLVRVHSGADGSVLHSWDGFEQIQSPSGGHFGYRVSGGGDLNGDGFDDVLAVAPNAFGGDGVFVGFSGRTGVMLWRSFAPDPSFRLEHHDFLGDLDHDGQADFAIGNPHADHSFSSAGRITVFAGALGDAERLCDVAPNSVGPGAVLELGGPISVGNDALRLLISGAVPGETGLWFYGTEGAQVPFGMGWLCTQGPFFRLGPPQVVDPDGTDERPLDFSAPPLGAGPGQVDPGSSWTFQYAYRDPAFGAGFNFSDALSVLFTP